jgi:hypothetical protein
MSAHAKQFNSKVLVEEIQYQKSLRFFAKKYMTEGKIEPFDVDAIPHDAQKNAKELRIRALEPLINNGMLHILAGMKDLMEELEDYPYASTRDIVDMLGYAWRHTQASQTVQDHIAEDPFALDTIVREIEEKKGREETSIVADPFGAGDESAWGDRFVT